MEALGLDFKLLLAQIVNFGLLWFILSKFVYKPVLKLLDDRKKKIAASLDDAKKIETRLAEIEEKEKEILNKATIKASVSQREVLNDAKLERTKILDSARKDAQKETQKAVERIHAEELALYSRLKAKLVSDIADETAKRLRKNSSEDNFPLLSKLLNK